MSTKLVVLKTFMYAHESGVCASLLESEGIHTELMNEHAVQSVSIYSNALGGVKLMVPEDLYQQAVQILVQHGLMTQPQIKPVKIPLESLTAHWPLLRYFSPVMRLMLLLALCLTISAVLLYYIFN